MLMSPRKLTLIVTLVGASVTVLIAVLPFVQFAYRSPAGHLALDTAAGFIALLTAYMVLGRLRRLGLASDFLMAYSLAVFCFTNLFLSAVADIVAGPERQLFSTWSVLGARFVAATTFMVSAFLPETRLIRNRSRGLLVVVGALITVIAMGALEATIGSRLARAIPPNLSPTNLVRPLIVGHPTVLGLQLIMMAMFAVAAVTFTRRAERTGDELLKWFGAAAALGAFARANYFLFPSLYSHYLYTGDLLRLGFYALLLVGATREIGRYWGSLSEVAVLEERRRLARDLHDGLGQELSYIWRESRRFQDGNASLILQRV
jgi:signal transduction histidine kinase